MSGAGPAIDPNGNVYVATGNGNYDGIKNFGEAILQFSATTPALPGNWMPTASYTPTAPQKGATLAGQDWDLGASGPMIIPTPELGPGIQSLIQIDKLGTLYQLSDAPSNALGTDLNVFVSTAQPKANLSTGNGPAYNAGVYSAENQVYYTWPSGDVIRGLEVIHGYLNTTLAGSFVGNANPQGVDTGQPGAGLTISSNGTSCASPSTTFCADSTIIWATQSKSGNSGDATVPGYLAAYGANLGAPLWTSSETWNLAKWNPPTVANGKVYVPTFSNKVLVYGGPTQSAGCWHDSFGAGPSIAVTAPNGVVAVGLNNQVWYWVGSIPQASGTWRQEGTIPATILSVMTDYSGDVYAVDSTGVVWVDSNFGAGNWSRVFNRFFWGNPSFNDYTSLAYLGTTSPEFMSGSIAGAGPDFLAVANLSFTDTFATLATGQAPAAVATFSLQSQLWALSTGGELFGYDGTLWGEQPGWTVTALTDHYATTASALFWWNDSAPNFLANQPFQGNWVNPPFVSTLPGGLTYAQIAHAPTITTSPYNFNPIGSGAGIWATNTNSEIYFLGLCP